MESNAIIQDWLDNLAFSAATWDLDAHMALVSRQVTVIGIPGVDKIDYQGWKLRRRNEFKKKLLHSLTHREATLLNERPKIITFSVKELMRDQEKQCIELEKEITLQQEEDGKWRVVRELILNIEDRRQCVVAAS